MFNYDPFAYPSDCYPNFQIITVTKIEKLQFSTDYCGIVVCFSVFFFRVPVKYGGIAQYPQVSLQPSSKRHGIASALATMPVLGLNWGCKATYLVLITLYSYIHL